MNLFDLLIPAAYAAPAGVHPQAAGGMSSLIMLGGFIVIFYFIMWRPQAKRQKEHRNLIGALVSGDEIVTNGGMLGRISRVAEDFIEVEIAKGVMVKIQKQAVAAALPKGTAEAI